MYQLAFEPPSLSIYQPSNLPRITPGQPSSQPRNQTVNQATYLARVQSARQTVNQLAKLSTKPPTLRVPSRLSSKQHTLYTVSHSTTQPVVYHCSHQATKPFNHSASYPPMQPPSQGDREDYRRTDLSHSTDRVDNDERDQHHRQDPRRVPEP